MRASSYLSDRRRRRICDLLLLDVNVESLVIVAISSYLNISISIVGFAQRGNTHGVVRLELRSEKKKWPHEPLSFPLLRYRCMISQSLFSRHPLRYITLNVQTAPYIVPPTILTCRPGVHLHPCTPLYACESKLVPVNENWSIVASCDVNKVVTGWEPAGDVGGGAVSDRNTQVLLSLHQQHASCRGQLEPGSDSEMRLTVWTY